MAGGGDCILSATTSAKETAISLPEPLSVQLQHLAPEVQVVTCDGREVVLVGTAHVSRASAELVRAVIAQSAPDAVCVELDAQRYAALTQQRRWEDLDLKTVIRQRRLGVLLVNLLLAAYQHRLGAQLGVLPGSEQLEAIALAQQRGIPVVLCDRDLRVTLQRAWRLTPFRHKLRLLAVLLGSLFDAPELGEATLHQLRQQDVLTAFLQELGAALPTMKRVLIDERDAYLAHCIRNAAGQRLVAVVGAGHVEGIRRALQHPQPVDLAALTAVPPPSRLGIWLRWAVPGLVVGALLALGWRRGAAVVGENLLYWTLVNGIPSALGALAALAHPLTVLAAFVAAPLTSLTPVIGAGYVTALVQAYVRPPRVRELRSVTEDVRRLRRWWQNRLLRIFLAFLLPSLGSLLGTWLGGYRLFSSLLAPGAP
ncbi:MAG: conjugal transfer protein TraB [Candidatus Tectimicrobiota bacterium]|nr:MAG: conjugal transfer protein TraB [Candidatus Tectomicrobia bacterium]